MNKRQFLRGSATAAVLSVLPFRLLAQERPAPPRKRLNLLFITADDLDESIPGYISGRQGLTPNLDALAARSHRFLRNRTVAPICMPSREAFMTGLLPHHSGGTGFIAINEGTPTLTTVLQAEGYYTAAIHKVDHMQPQSAFPWDYVQQSKVRNTRVHAEGLATAIAEAKGASKPFFVQCNINDPHRPFYGSAQAAKIDHDDQGPFKVAREVQPAEVIVPPMLDDLPDVRVELAQYWNSAQRLDLAVGEILKALERSGEASNTAIVFCNDHGMPFPFAKATCYDHGTRQPFLMFWPGMPGPQTYDTLTSSVDLLPTLLDLLEHLIDWTRDAPLFLLCLARPDLLDVRPTWGAQAHAETFPLEPLSEAESDELIDELMSRSELAVEARAKVSEVAAGNPLFVEQLLAMFSEGGDRERVPPTIQALLAARLDALPDEEREVLERAAVVGLEFEWEALGELAPDRRRPSGAQLAALVRKDLIRPHEAIEDTFRFRHLLIRDAAYERISKQVRSELHERFAGWLDGRGEEFDEIVGYHLEQAYRCLAELGRSGDRAPALAESAAQRLGRAGKRAYARADSRAAMNLLARAAKLLPAEDPRRLSFLPLLGRALRAQGELDRADALLDEAVERGRSAGERAIAADAGIALADLRYIKRPVARGRVCGWWR